MPPKPKPKSKSRDTSTSTPSPKPSAGPSDGDPVGTPPPPQQATLEGDPLPREEPEGDPQPPHQESSADESSGRAQEGARVPHHSALTLDEALAKFNAATATLGVQQHSDDAAAAKNSC